MRIINPVTPTPNVLFDGGIEEKALLAPTRYGFARTTYPVLASMFR
jgi:hypothetical protein